ncbi:MAG TPA: RcnB family protein [Phenylobacterium sp.]|nr:RcnB family protein [Phenylobacterium sp.]
MLLMAAVASVASSMPLAAPAFARDDDRGRRAERHDGRGRGSERGGYDRRGGGPVARERGDGRWNDDGRYRGRPDDRSRDVDERPRYQDRPYYEDRRRDDERGRPDYMQGPRPNYMRPVPGSGRRGYLPDNYRGEVVENYPRYRLRPPPHGYAWVRVGAGFALVEMDSGRIFDRVN